MSAQPRRDRIVAVVAVVGQVDAQVRERKGETDARGYPLPAQ